MSTRIMQENLDQFLQMVAQDLELQEKLKDTFDRDAYISSVVKLGNEKGYSFSNNEVVAALEAAVQEANGNDVSVSRLSEHELEAVAGGGLFSRLRRRVGKLATVTDTNPFCTIIC
jgi:predicted ribosomally synthesized peptide with nif11-like leader